MKVINHVSFAGGTTSNTITIDVPTHVQNDLVLVFLSLDEEISSGKTIHQDLSFLGITSLDIWGYWQTPQWPEYD